jgi:pimeloyl-ACP methyl ester carboxylesterase
MVHLPIPKVSEECDGCDETKSDLALTLMPSQVYFESETTPWSPARGFQDTDEFPPVFGTNVTRMDADYCARRDQLREQLFTLQDKRKLCFWADGDSSGIPVLAFHGGCDTKCRFIQKQPLPGVYLIAVDRPGYGGSSPVPVEYTFKQAVEDIVALADHLGLDQFVVMGHGIGASWALQIAAAVPQRVRGAIAWSTMADPLHSKATMELRNAQGYRGGLMFARSGACYLSPRSFMVGSKKVGAKNEFFMDNDDFGVMGLKKEQIAGPEFFAKYAADSFWVSQTLDGWKHRRAHNAVLGDVNRTLCGRWFYNVEDIQCPTFLYHGEADYDAKCPEVPHFMQQLMPHADLEVIQGCGHICSFGPNEETSARIIAALSKMPLMTTS